VLEEWFGPCRRAVGGGRWGRALSEPHAHGYTKALLGGKLLGHLTCAMASDDRRQSTLSYNPLHRADGTADTVLGLFSPAFCPPAGRLPD
jgi:hypothetical protein